MYVTFRVHHWLRKQAIELWDLPVRGKIARPPDLSPSPESGGPLSFTIFTFFVRDKFEARFPLDNMSLYR